MADVDIELEKLNKEIFFDIVVYKALPPHYSRLQILLGELSEHFLQSMTIVEVGINMTELHLLLSSFVELLHLIAAEVEIPPETKVRLLSKLLLDDFSQPEVDENWLVSLARDSYIFRFHVEVDDVKVVKDFHGLYQTTPIKLLQIFQLHQAFHLSHCVNNRILVHNEIEAERIVDSWSTSQAVYYFCYSVLLCN